MPVYSQCINTYSVAMNTDKMPIMFINLPRLCPLIQFKVSLCCVCVCGGVNDINHRGDLSALVNSYLNNKVLLNIIANIHLAINYSIIYLAK